MNDTLTLDQLFERFAAESGDLKPSSLATYRADVAVFRDYWATAHDTPPCVSDLSQPALEGCMGWMVGRGRSRATANRMLRGAKAIWTWAADRGLHDSRPPKTKPLRELKRQPEAWTPAEFDAIVGAARRLTGQCGPTPKAAVVELILRLLFNSGARLRACLAIQCEWVDLTAGTIRIDATVQKDSETQIVQILPGTAASLQAVAPFGRIDRVCGDWPYSPRAFDECLRRLIVDAGLRPDRRAVTRRDLAHRIRRCYATQLYAATRDLEYVRQRLGHSKIETSRRYIDWSQIPRAGEREYLRDPRPADSQLRLFTA